MITMELKDLIVKHYNKNGSVSKTRDILKGLFPEVTDELILATIPTKESVTTEKKPVEKPTKISAKIAQADAMSALYAFYSKMRTFEKESIKKLSEEEQHQFRTFMLEAFTVIKDI